MSPIFHKVQRNFEKEQTFKNLGKNVKTLRI